MANIFRPDYRVKGFSLGKPEAEAESNVSDNFSLKNLFVDELNIADALRDKLFIIIGRKGTGKSAIGAHYILGSHQFDKNSTKFVDIIKPSFGRSVSLRDMGLSCEDEYKYYFQWLIISKLIKLIIDSEQGQCNDEIKALKRFYNKYFSLFQINDSSNGFEMVDLSISVNLLMGKFGASFARSNRRDDKQPQPFYLYIPGLFEVIGKVLGMPLFKGFEFTLMFDDLDVGLNLNDEEHCKKLMALIRVVKDFNNNPTLSANSRVIVFVRDDVKRKLAARATDMTKIFGSYSFTLNWYDNPKKEETTQKLRKLVNRRISQRFRNKGLNYNQQDPWQSYISENGPSADGTVFKALLDYTFYRPRDFINLFKQLDYKEHFLPLDKDSLKELLRNYSDIAFEEIMAELNARFTQAQIRDIRKVLSKTARMLKDTNSDALTFEQFKGIEPTFLTDEMVEEMFSYDLIGLVDYNKDLHFHFRESFPTTEISECGICMPRIVRLYFDRSSRIRL